MFFLHQQNNRTELLQIKQQESRMAYGTADEALSQFSWLKIGSGEVGPDWDKFKYSKSKYKI